MNDVSNKDQYIREAASSLFSTLTIYSISIEEAERIFDKVKKMYEAVKD